METSVGSEAAVDTKLLDENATSLTEESNTIDKMDTVSLDADKKVEESSINEPAEPSIAKYFQTADDQVFDQLCSSKPDPTTTAATTDTTTTETTEQPQEEPKESAPLFNLFATVPVPNAEAANIFDTLASKTDTARSQATVLSPSSPKIDDPFSASIQASESDRRHDAWIPSSTTLDALVRMATSPHGTFFPERTQLTMPGIVLEEDLVDAVREYLAYHVGEEAASKRNVPTAGTVSQDEHGLRKLIESGCHRAAVNLTGRLLALHGQGAGKIGHITKMSPQILQIWFVRLSLLVKLRQFAIAQVESEPFGDLNKPDLFYEFYPEIYGARKGTMVPFSFRVLIAELPLHNGEFADALDRLFVVLATVKKILRNLENGLAEDGSMIELSDVNRKASLLLWKKREIRVLFSILNCLIAQKDVSSCATIVQEIVSKDATMERQLLSLLGRVYLLLGDVKAAHEAFHRAKEGPAMSDQDKVAELVNSGFLDIAHNRFDAAYSKFKSALDISPKNPLCINNMAVCLLYMKRLHDAVELLETNLQQDPTRFLHEGVLFNVCTLYELESYHTVEKKHHLLDAISKNLGDAFNITCLKMPIPS